MIKNLGQMQQSLKSYDMNSWSKSVDLGKELNFKELPSEKIGESNGTQSFGDFLANSISKVNNLQHDANTAMEKLASGKSQNLHETLLTVEKAEIAFKTMNQVRSKVIDAYKEIMKMQI